MKLQPYNDGSTRADHRSDLDIIEAAHNTLRSTRGALRAAGATKAARAVSKALKSVEGAIRHAQRRDTASRTYGAMPPGKYGIAVESVFDLPGGGVGFEGTITSGPHRGKKITGPMGAG